MPIGFETAYGTLDSSVALGAQHMLHEKYAGTLSRSRSRMPAGAAVQQRDWSLGCPGRYSTSQARGPYEDHRHSLYANPNLHAVDAPAAHVLLGRSTRGLEPLSSYQTSYEALVHPNLATLRLPARASTHWRIARIARARRGAPAAAAQQASTLVRLYS